MSGKLLPAPLLAEMLHAAAPRSRMDYGLGVFVQDLGDDGTVITHNGGAAGHAALMYSTPDGRRTLTAALNYVDDAACRMARSIPTRSAAPRRRGLPPRVGTEELT